VTKPQCNLTHSEINRIAFEVRGDLLDPEQPDPGQIDLLSSPIGAPIKYGPSQASSRDARQLLDLFAGCVEEIQRASQAGNMLKGSIAAYHPIPDRLLEHFRSAIRSFLNGDRKTLDAAFGIAPSDGPGRPPDNQLTIAVKILRHRLAGLTVERILPRLKVSRNTATKAWTARSVGALIFLDRERALCGQPFTDQERSILRKIYKTKNGHICPPGWELHDGALVQKPQD
jgi:hypothetical protein